MKWMHVARWWLALSVVWGLGCTRDIEPQSVSMTLNLQAPEGFSAQSTEMISHIVVNVSGEGMPRKVWNWDAYDSCFDCTTAPTAPTQIQLSVPSGAARLIQVLLVKEDTTTEAMTFAYGDSTSDLTPGTVSVDVAVQAIGTASGKEGSIHGRYKSTTGSHYTGDLIMAFQPPVAGKPPMEIMRMEMFSGWFNIFLLEGVNFRYIAADTGELLFGGAVNLASALFTASSSVMRFSAPATYYDWDSDGTADDQRPSEEHVLGFWQGSDVAATGAACYDNTSINFTNIYTDSSLTTPATWPADFTVSGGGNCSIPTPPISSSSIAMDAYTLESGGGDQLLFHGPFMKFKHSTAGHYTAIEGSYDSTNSTVSVQWKYMPQVFSETGAIDGVAVLVSRTFAGGDLERGPNGVDCKALLSEGFSEYKRTVGSSETSVTITNVTQTDLESLGVVLCPYKGTKYFRSAIYPHNMGSGGGTSPDPSVHYGDGSDGTLEPAYSTWENFGGIRFNHVSLTTSRNDTKMISAARRVTGVSSDGLTLSLGAAFSVDDFNAGDEILWVVQSGNAASSPDTNACGGGLYRGKYGFAHLSSVDTTNTTVTMDSSLGNDPANIANANLAATPAAGATFCHIQLVRVPNFSKIYIPSGMTLTLEAPAYDYSTTGGLIAFRAQEIELVGNLVLTATKRGFYSATGQGSGLSGPGATDNSANNENGGGGGATSPPGAGGGNAGAGGNNSSDSAIGGAPLTYCSGDCFIVNQKKIFFGGGAGGNGSFAGGHGGGAVFVHADYIHGTGSFSIQANGGPAGAEGGGGAGGSLHLTSSQINSTVSLSANGGDAGGTTGAGGGGFAEVSYCASAPSSVTPSLIALGGSGTGTVAGGAGAVLTSDEPGLCY